MNRYIFVKNLISYVTYLFISIFLGVGIYFFYNLILIKVFNEIIVYKLQNHDFAISYSMTSDVVSKSVEPSNAFVINTTQYSKIAYVFDEYFKENNSPLYGFGQTFVDACEKFNTPEDCTLLPAIARVETNLCTTDISADQHNCWGFGGSGNNRIIYPDFKTAIFDITGRLMQGYGINFFNDPEIGELFYCGGHCVTWGDKVKMEQNILKARIESVN